jgi:transcriptional regulator with XRE-family HTH domain
MVKSKVMRKYHNRLRDLREDRDMTQAQVAKIFYLQVTQYRRYENGESDLPLEWAKKFAEYYGVSIDYIAGITDTPN